MQKTRKLLVFLLALCMILGLLAGCTKTPVETQPSDDPTAAPTTAPTEAPTEPIEEFFLEKEPGCNQLTLYWNSPNTDYSKCDVWMWFEGKDGRAYEFHRSAYGVKCMINVPEEIPEVGFIVRKNCSDPGGTSWGEATKDYDADRFAVMTGPDTVIYLKPGDASQYYSEDGGKTLQKIRLFSMCGMIAANQIQYYLTPALRITDLSAVHVYEEDKEIAVEALSSLNNEVVTGIITTKEPMDLSRNYKVTIDGFGTCAVVPTGIFDSEDFVAQYTYDGDDLGAVVNGDETTFKLWAPTASEVTLNLFEAGEGGSAYKTVPMERADKGVWQHTEACGSGTYYTYSVKTALGTQEAVDPYAKAAGVNGNRGMVIDLSTTNPEGFAESGYYEDLETYQDAIIWEVHVRDFSNMLESSEYKGKYLAFTETGLKNANGLPAGIDYLKELGITHVHLQPVYDYATVDEANPDKQFNWGYDPKNYNVPEGSYSTDPFHGEVRILEFKEMVEALHENGFGVIMDVVYNHTYDINSNLNKVVPYYYYRYNGMGVPSNGSGCGNETASERVMYRKYMVDSVTYWATEYKVDGFRFDLMALHDVATMQAIEEAVHAINPKALIYGEGWTGGTTTLRSNLQATQANISQVTASEGAAGSVAVFNDAIRDGLKGSVFDMKDAGYINGGLSKAAAYKVITGLIGGERSSGATWSVDNNMIINYMSCHDNATLWDKLLATNPDPDEGALLAMNRLGAQIVMISKGTPFFLAGEEMLRTKDGDTNSYNSSDAINNLKWEDLTEDSDAWRMVQYYAQLIALRKTLDFVKNSVVKAEILDGNVILVSYYAEDGETLTGLAVINPYEGKMSYTLPEGEWCQLLNGFDIDPAGETILSGSVNVENMSVLLVKAK